MTLAELIAEDRAVNPNGRSFLFLMAEEMLHQSKRLDDLETLLRIICRGLSPEEP